MRLYTPYEMAYGEKARRKERRAGFEWAPTARFKKEATAYETAWVLWNGVSYGVHSFLWPLEQRLVELLGLYKRPPLAHLELLECAEVQERPRLIKKHSMPPKCLN